VQAGSASAAASWASMKASTSASAVAESGERVSERLPALVVTCVVKLLHQGADVPFQFLNTGVGVCGDCPASVLVTILPGFGASSRQRPAA
jgi:hypothetical protein